MDWVLSSIRKFIICCHTPIQLKCRENADIIIAGEWFACIYIYRKHHFISNQCLQDINLYDGNNKDNLHRTGTVKHRSNINKVKCREATQ